MIDLADISEKDIIQVTHETAANAKRVMLVNQTGTYVDASGGGGGGDGAINDGVTSTIKATVKDYAADKPLCVRLTDTAGNYVAGGGGTEYAEGDTDASITGKAILWEDTGDALRSVSAVKPLPVDVKNSSIAVTGTFYQATQPVSGTFFQATQPVSATDLDIRNLTSVSDSVEVKQATGTSLHAVIDSGTITTITNAVTVSGTVTANAGTNLNTSTLALETGGNLATIAGDTTSIDGKITACNTGAVVVSSGTITGITNAVQVGDNSSSLTVDTTGTSGLEIVQGTAADLNCTEANSGSIKTSVELIDDAVYTDGTGTPSKGLAVMGTDGTNPQIISTNATGHVNIADGGNTITVDGTVTSNQGGSPWQVQSNSANIGTETTLSTINTKLVSGTDIGDVTINNASGASAVNIQDGGNTITVDGTIAGTGNFTVIQGTGTNLHAVIDSGSTTAVTQTIASNLNAQAVGSVAHDGADAGNPVKIGLKAITHGKIGRAHV